MLVDSFLDPFHQRGVLPRVGKSNLFTNKKFVSVFGGLVLGGRLIFRGSFWWPM